MRRDLGGLRLSRRPRRPRLRGALRAARLERARTAIGSSEAVTDGGADVEERGDHIVIGRDATLTDVLLVRDGHGVGRAVESEISFHPVPPAELRADLEKLLGLFFTLGDELDAWVFDHFARRFVTRGETDELLAAYAGGFDDGHTDVIP